MISAASGVSHRAGAAKRGTRAPCDRTETVLRTTSATSTGVTHEELVKDIRIRAALADEAQAEMLFHSFLRLFGSRIQPEAAENLAAQLPMQTAEYLTRDQRFQRLDREQFLNHLWEPLADWESRDQAGAHAAAVIAALRDALSDGTIDRLQAQFPPDFEPLFKG